MTRCGKWNMMLVLLLLVIAAVPMQSMGMEVRVKDRGEHTIVIGWDAVQPQAGGYYKIWREKVGVSGPVIIATPEYSASKYTDEDLEKGTQYKYVVERYDSLDNFMDRGNVTTCTQKEQSVINWAFVVGGVLIIVFLLVFIFMTGGAMLQHPVSLAAIVGVFVAGIGLIYVGITATGLVSPC